MSANDHHRILTETHPVFADEIAVRLTHLASFLKAEAARLSATEHLFPENSAKARALVDDAARTLYIARRLEDRAGEQVV
jgi:hypothetical protein